MVVMMFDSSCRNKQCCFKFNKMTDYEKMIAKLNNLNFIKRDGDKFISEEGFTFMWDMKLHTALHNNPIQLVVHIHYDKVAIAFWGCEDVVDTKAFAFFIEKTKGKIYSHQGKEEDRKYLFGKALFNSL